MSCSYKDVCG